MSRQQHKGQAAGASVSRAYRGGRMVTAAMVAVVAIVAVVVLYLVYRGGSTAPDSAASGSGYPHVAGEPSVGAPAPAFTLNSGDGRPVSLNDYRGRTVLLYFQEGLSCQPCWDQIRDLEQNQSALRAAGVDAVVSITTDPATLIGRKAADERLTTPILSDPDLAVSRAYDANKYGMMGDMRDGHTFVLVGPDGTIQWRADYGGAPDYTMFLPTDKMLADLNTERIQ
ncbi:peroxiredoxin family protein [Mycobacterium hubeiense]|uniref:peroxiredoxin family protein n=1 Tax=Mycobacterium hubeiense TaxID=1867256 RepID=UPI000C7F5EE5|nr:peroxiredoxin family protein [Mycobacterium sp. QGD 101]